MAGRENDSPDAVPKLQVQLSDVIRHGRGRHESVAGDMNFIHVVGASHFDDDFHCLPVVAAAVTPHHQSALRRQLVLTQRQEQRLDEVRQVVRGLENRRLVSS